MISSMSKQVQVVTPDNVLFTTTRAAARALGVTSETIRAYLRRGELAGFPVQTGPRPDANDRPRRTPRGRYLVSTASMERFIERRLGEAVAIRWRRDPRAWRLEQKATAMLSDTAGNP